MEDFDADDVARAAGVSYYHIHRYIAALDLQPTEIWHGVVPLYSPDVVPMVIACAAMLAEAKAERHQSDLVEGRWQRAWTKPYEWLVWVARRDAYLAEHPETIRPRPAGAEWERTRALVFARDGYACTYCGSKEYLACDHIVPFSRGGSNEPDNLTTACWSCNSSKGDRTPEEWQRRVARTC